MVKKKEGRWRSGDPRSAAQGDPDRHHELPLGVRLPNGPSRGIHACRALQGLDHVKHQRRRSLKQCDATKIYNLTLLSKKLGQGCVYYN